MSSFKTLSRANRQMQLDSWTPVILDIATVCKISRDAKEEGIDLEDFQTGDTKGTMKFYLEDWCRKTIKGGFAVSEENCLTFLFQRSSEAVRFKLTWGGR